MKQHYLNSKRDKNIVEKMQCATIIRYNIFLNENSKQVLNQFQNLAPTFWFMTKPDKTDYEVPEM